jgi:hypothetical protein
LYWNRQPIDGYELYELKGESLESFTIVKDTSLLLHRKDHPGLYYAIAPLLKGKPGWRSAILNYKAQGVDCYFKSFFLQTQNTTTASFVSSLGSTFGVRVINFQKLKVDGFEVVQHINDPTVTSFVFSDDQLIRGVNQYRLQLVLMNGQILYSDVISLYHFPDHDVIIYPNPVKKNQPVQIITSKAGRKTVQVLNSNGVLIQELHLKELKQQIQTLQLSNGLYFIRIIDGEDHSVYTQKLIVY